MVTATTRWLFAATSIGGFTFGGCGIFRPSVTLEPISLVRVTADQMPGSIRHLPHGGSALRIDFYARPELLAEDVYSVIDHERFCDAADEKERLFGMPSPFVGEKEIVWQDDRVSARAELASRGQTSLVVYSIYVYIRDKEHPASPGSSFHPGYDLEAISRPLCVWVELHNGYEFSRTTNVMIFAAEQVASALKTRR